MSDDIEKKERVKRPEPEVLGADGLPIEVGDTVYLESFGRPFTVVGFDGSYLKDADGGLLRANYAMHTSPDTQELINEDASMHPHEYCKKYGIQVGTIDDAQYTLSNFVDPMVFNLLRRQRELDARTMGGE